MYSYANIWRHNLDMLEMAATALYRGNMTEWKKKKTIFPFGALYKQQSYCKKVLSGNLATGDS